MGQGFIVLVILVAGLIASKDSEDWSWFGWSLFVVFLISSSGPQLEIGIEKENTKQIEESEK